MEHIKDLQRRDHRVVMVWNPFLPFTNSKHLQVGDGINDSLAQAAADVGISISLTQGCLSGAGSVVIVSGSLHALSSIFAISRRVVAQARLNVMWALVYNVVAISMALGLWERCGIRITA